MMEVVYTWPDGREEVRYRRSMGTAEARDLERQVDHLREDLGPKCPYSIRYMRPCECAIGLCEHWSDRQCRMKS